MNHENTAQGLRVVAAPMLGYLVVIVSGLWLGPHLSAITRALVGAAPQDFANPWSTLADQGVSALGVVAGGYVAASIAPSNRTAFGLLAGFIYLPTFFLPAAVTGHLVEQFTNWRALIEWVKIPPLALLGGWLYSRQLRSKP